MHRSSASTAVAMATNRLLLRGQACDVFINHRGVDTKRNVAGLLHHHLRGVGLHPFLDSKSLDPGDRLFDGIRQAIGGCKVGVAVFSPQYCRSYFCLHELALFTECRKRVVPVFCDLKPSQLRADDVAGCSPEDIRRFRYAIEQAKYTVGLTFDTTRGDWAEFLARATDVVLKNIIEVEGEEEKEMINNKYPFIGSQAAGISGKEGHNSLIN